MKPICLPDPGHSPDLRHLSNLNRRKILSKNAFTFLFAVLTALSFYNLSSVMDGYLKEGRYEIADGTEYRLFYETERLTANKIGEMAEKYGGLVLPMDIGRVAAADARVVRMIAQVYGWDLGAPALDALSDERFYGDRAAAIAALGTGGPAAVFGEPAYPLELGYAEGWKNINAGMGRCVQVVLVIVFLALIPLYNEDKTLGVDSLIRSTKWGKAKLDGLRIVNALQLAAALYGIAVALYILPIAIVYGLDGAALPIQGDPLYFLSPVGLSFFGQFAADLLIGLIAVAGMTGLTLLISAAITEVFTGYAALLFVAALSYLIDLFDLAGFRHFLWNFSPVGLTDFSAYSAGRETYFGVPSLLFTPLLAAGSLCVEYFLLLFLLRKKRGPAQRRSGRFD